MNCKTAAHADGCCKLQSFHSVLQSLRCEAGGDSSDVPAHVSDRMQHAKISRVKRQWHNCAGPQLYNEIGNRYVPAGIHQQVSDSLRHTDMWTRCMA